jgi:hypothetical protein
LARIEVFHRLYGVTGSRLGLLDTQVNHFATMTAGVGRGDEARVQFVDRIGMADLLKCYKGGRTDLAQHNGHKTIVAMRVEQVNRQIALHRLRHCGIIAPTDAIAIDDEMP